MQPPTPEHRERFKQLIHDHDAAGLRALLDAEPATAQLVEERCFSFGATALIAARNDRAMVDVLLDAGADVDGRSDWWAGSFGPLDGTTPEMAEYLISRGATLDAWSAAQLGWLERLREILARDPEQADRPFGDGQRPLHVAATCPIADLLLEHGATLEARDVDHGSTPAQYQIDNPEVCRHLLDRGAEPDIFIACALGEVGLAERVLARDPRALGHRIGAPPFVSPGSEGGHIYLYKLGYTTRPLALAAARGHSRLVAALLERASPVERLLFHGWQADADAVRKLVEEHPGLVEALDRWDMAVLADAAWENRLDSVRVLLDAGFDPKVRGVDDSTPLDRAAFHGYREVARLLIARGAPLDCRNTFGGSPLEACIYGSIHGWRKDGDPAGTLELLLDAGAVAPEEARGSAEVQAVLRRWGAR